MFDRSLQPLFVFALLALNLGSAAQAQISLTALDVPVSENFDGLAAAGTAVAWVDNGTLPGWYSNRATYHAANGSNNAGSLYSFGVTGAGPATDRALGGISSNPIGTFHWAARYVNDTGSTINRFSVAFTGEQWRDGGAATPAAQSAAFQYQVAAAGVITDASTPGAGWADLSALSFTSPTFSDTGGGVALDGNAAANRRAIGGTLTVSIAPGEEIWIRWQDLNNGGNDHGLAIDDLTVVPSAVLVLPILWITDVGLLEGDAGTSTFSFTINLSKPAVAGGVVFDIATSDGTATLADNDYQASSLSGATMDPGDSTFQFEVTVNGDLTFEASETFLVDLTSVEGAIVYDGHAVGTLVNDEYQLTPIHDIQGPGATSPLLGFGVTTRGVVTGVRSDGFFMQEPDASADADPATSEGIFVFTDTTPGPEATLGFLVEVSATVAEFVPPRIRCSRR
jgi:uncharacterized protein